MFQLFFLRLSCKLYFYSAIIFLCLQHRRFRLFFFVFFFIFVKSVLSNVNTERKIAVKHHIRLEKLQRFFSLCIYCQIIIWLNLCSLFYFSYWNYSFFFVILLFLRSFLILIVDFRYFYIGNSFSNRNFFDLSLKNSLFSTKIKLRSVHLMPGR